MRRTVLRKLDWNTLPALSLLWLACFSESSESDHTPSHVCGPTGTLRHSKISSASTTCRPVFSKSIAQTSAMPRWLSPPDLTDADALVEDLFLMREFLTRWPAWETRWALKVFNSILPSRCCKSLGYFCVSTHVILLTSLASNRDLSYVGYIIVEIPSTHILRRVGARVSFLVSTLYYLL